MLGSFTKGLAIGAGLIIAIGAQNAFVLKQGILRSHVGIISLICILIDSVCIIIGALGLGKIIISSPLLLDIAKFGGMLFLFFYGLKAFKSSFSNTQAIELSPNSEESMTLKNAVLITLAVSLLNPHLYLDTIVLLGSIAAQHEGNGRIYFAFGAITSSILWFTSLAVGASYLGPLFKKPYSWKILNFLIGIMMWSIAISLWWM